MGSVINVEQPVSKHFILDDLIQTKTGIFNMPEPSHIENLKRTGTVLDALYDSIGPFVIHSGFRTKELQDRLNKSSKTSFHELGLAIDLTPVGISTEEYFSKILANKRILSLMGEISHKPTQNSIHFSTKVPGVQTKIMERDASGFYSLMDPVKIAGLISKYKGELTVGVGGILVFMMGLFLAFKKKRK